MKIEHLESGEILSQAVVHGDTVYMCGLTAKILALDVTGQTNEVLSCRRSKKQIKSYPSAG